MLELVNINKNYNPGSVNELFLFKDFNLTVKDGDFVSVVGSNGSGKTSMLNIICGSIAVDSGKILVSGEDITRQKDYIRQRRIGRVYQDPSKGTCPGMTILENMSIAENKGKPYNLGRGVNKAKLEEYREMLRPLNLGLEDKMGVQVGSLSGGQRQALALLMATMTPIDFLILDEVFLNHPASAAGKDFVAFQIRCNVLCADSAGRHEFYSCVRSRHSFDHCKTARLFSREEFDHFKATFYSLSYFRWSDASRKNGDAFFQTVVYDLRIEARAYDEFCACAHCTVNLLSCENSTCTYAHFREFLAHDTDGFLSCVSTECNLCTWKSALHQRFCKVFRVFCIVQNNNRNDDIFLKLF